MPPVGLEPKISAGERPQTYALDRAATGTGDVRISAFTKLLHVFTVRHQRMQLYKTIVKLCCHLQCTALC